MAVLSVYFYMKIQKKIKKSKKNQAFLFLHIRESTYEISDIDRYDVFNLTAKSKRKEI